MGGRAKLGAKGWFGGRGGNSGKCQESLHWLWMERKSRIGKISNRVMISNVVPITSYISITWEFVKNADDWVSSQTY